jgi:hypothetical protein
MEIPPLRGPHLHLLGQRIENYALFPEVSLQKPVAQRPGASAHDLVRKNKERHIYDREQRAYHQTLKADYEPEQQRALIPQQHHAHAHLYFHRPQTVEQPA